MKKEEHINYWIDSAKHDLSSAVTLFEQEKYDWCLFLGHLVLEKVLKAYYVKMVGVDIPKIHNLLKIAELANLPLTESQKLDLLNFNDFNIEVRYPDYKFSFYKKCTKDFTQNNFGKIKDMFECLIKRVQEI